MTTLFTTDTAHGARPALGEVAARMHHGFEWEMLSRSPERRP